MIAITTVLIGFERRIKVSCKVSRAKMHYNDDVLWSYTTMQISRHWRLNSQRYRLQGVRYENGEVSLQNRPTFLTVQQQQETKTEIQNTKPELKAAS